MTPQPLGQAEIGAYAADKLRRVGSDQPLPGPRIDLYEAFARALKYNLDQRVEIMQTAVRARELSFASYSMLPNFVANSAYAGRDNYAASSSISVLSQRQSLEPSYSQDRNFVFGDLSLSWNILDFGLSYVRARQAADAVLIAEENRRRVVSRIIEDVRTAYWRALTSERLASRLRALEGRAQNAISDARRLYNERQTSPITALTYERELIEIRREAQRVEADLLVARSQLASLMNLPRSAVPAGRDGGSRGGFEARRRRFRSRSRCPGEPVGTPRGRLSPAYQRARGDRRPAGNAARFQRHRRRQRRFEPPALQFELGRLGARASWNLMSVFRYPERTSLIDAQDALLDKRALAVTMAVMTQVHVSRIRHALAMKEFETAAAFRRVQRRIVGQMRASAAALSTSEQTLIREEMNTLIAEVKFDLAHAAVQNARANVFASLGLDSFPLATIDGQDLDGLTRAVRTSWLGIGAVLAEAPPIPRVPAVPPLRLRH
ncbi:TolC family protein [Methylorubrum suomiense]